MPTPTPAHLNARVVIIGGGVSGLATASRLVAMGFHVTVVDAQEASNSSDPPRTPEAAVSPASPTGSSGSSHVFPIVVHGFHTHTRSLLSRIDSPLLSAPPASTTLEFITPANPRPFRFRAIPAPAPLHALSRLVSFQGLSRQDRWSLLTQLEKQWEDSDDQAHKDLDRHSVKNWMAQFHQSAAAYKDIWNPLCQYVMGTECPHSSAQYFVTMVKSCCFSQSKHAAVAIPSMTEEQVFLRPLAQYLETRGAVIHRHRPAIAFDCDLLRMSGVRLHDGTTMTADYYVSALPHQRLLACLPERLLAKYSYFSNLSKLTDESILLVDLTIPYALPKPRLLLSPQTFHWMTLSPMHTGDPPATRIMCVGNGNNLLLSEPDHVVVERAQHELTAILPKDVKQAVEQPSAATVIRRPHSFLACHPNTSVLRPLQCSPVSNLFLAGPWTDTGLPSSRESSMASADLCAEAIQHAHQQAQHQSSA